MAVPISPSNSPKLSGSERRERRRRAKRGPQLFARDTLTGWLFLSPFTLGLIVFSVIPIIAAIWVSFTDWSGIVPPQDASWTGISNYKTLLIDDSLRRSDFALSLRNNFYFVVFVVPIQTALALLLAMVVHQKFLKGRSFFRLAFFFPSITSSIAVSLIFKFIFQVDGLANKIFPGPKVNWFGNSRGTFHNLLGVVGVDKPPGFMKSSVFGLPLWEWFAGPSVAMSAIMGSVIWTTSGTLMLIFIGGLQNVPESLEEAATLDGASGWKRMRHVTIPLIRPQIFLVLLLGFVGTWQVFDQIFAMSFGGPDKTTITPAFWVYFQSFKNGQAGLGAALAVILCGIIAFFTFVQRRLVSDKGFD